MDDRSRFRLGDLVFVQLHERPVLYSESAHDIHSTSQKPKRLKIIALVQTCEWSRGSEYNVDSRQVPGSEKTLYATSYSRDTWLADDRVFASVEDFIAVRGFEIAEMEAKAAAAGMAKREKAYREAKDARQLIERAEAYEREAAHLRQRVVSDESPYPTQAEMDAEDAQDLYRLAHWLRENRDDTRLACERVSDWAIRLLASWQAQ